MSQSDYLKYKRVSNELRINKLDPIFNQKDLLSYKEFSLENTIENTKITYNQLVLPDKKKIFNMEKNVLLCPIFNTCNNTNTRSNRKLLLVSQITPKPLQPLSIKQKNKELINMNFCNCTKI